MPGQFGQRLLEVVVQAVYAVLLRGGDAFQPSLPHEKSPQRLADVRVVADDLRDDVVGSLQGVGQRLHALFRVDVRLRRVLRRRAVLLLRQQQECQRLQTLLPGDGGAGAPLLLIGAVEILYLRQRAGVVDGGSQLIGELALPVDGGLHLLPPLVQIPQVLQSVLQLPQGGVVHGAVLLLAVAGDKGDGAALVQQGDDVLHVLHRLCQLCGQNLCDSLHDCSFQKTVPAHGAGTDAYL